MEAPLTETIRGYVGAYQELDQLTTAHRRDSQPLTQRLRQHLAALENLARARGAGVFVGEVGSFGQVRVQLRHAPPRLGLPRLDLVPQLLRRLEEERATLDTVDAAALVDRLLPPPPLPDKQLLQIAPTTGVRGDAPAEELPAHWGPLVEEYLQLKQEVHRLREEHRDAAQPLKENQSILAQRIGEALACSEAQTRMLRVELQVGNDAKHCYLYLKSPRPPAPPAAVPRKKVRAQLLDVAPALLNAARDPTTTSEALEALLQEALADVLRVAPPARGPALELTCTARRPRTA